MMNGDGRSVFIDTNVLVYSSVETAPLYADARAVLAAYRNQGIQTWISHQIMREYLATVTRPQTFMKPLSLQTAVDDVADFQRLFRVADVTAEVTSHLLTLVNQLGVRGTQIHDANIVATMQVYGIGVLRTHNVRDFNRYANLINVTPLEKDLR